MTLDGVSAWLAKAGASCVGEKSDMCVGWAVGVGICVVGGGVWVRGVREDGVSDVMVKGGLCLGLRA